MRTDCAQKGAAVREKTAVSGAPSHCKKRKSESAGRRAQAAGGRKLRVVLRFLTFYYCVKTTKML
ncbi:MAG TPA: hypothetical protein DDX51_04275 [Clostridiales bacterium]|nr:hypothetical protein [Clostridiales bacterium]